MNGKAIVLHPNGIEEQLLNKPSLEVAQITVGGYVQVIALDDGRQMLVNEQGLLEHKDPNPQATKLVNRERVLVHEMGIVGTVLILEGSYRWD